MREFLITIFVLFCIVLISAFIVLRIWENSRNKRTLDGFITENNTKSLGLFKCQITKNFWSPSNYNYAIDTCDLYRLTDGILVCPRLKILGVTNHLRPFVMSNAPLDFPGIQVCKIEEAQKINSNTFFKISTKYNTSMELYILDTKKIFD